MTRKSAALLTGVCLALTAVGDGQARRIRHKRLRMPSITFNMVDRPVANPRGIDGIEHPASLTGSTIAALDSGALVIDSDSGKLVRTGASGKAVRKLRIGAGAGLLAVDRDRNIAYVADRAKDRVVVVDVSGRKLNKKSSYKTPAEPYGVALTPDGNTLLVTTIADRQLVAFDTATGKQSWTSELEPEARGVAISPDGTKALVTFLTTGAVARFDLTEETPSPIYVPLDKGVRDATSNNNGAIQLQQATDGVRVVPPRGNAGRSFARSAFTAAYIGSIEVVPHQHSTPTRSNDGSENRSVYGGGRFGQLPIEHRLTFLSGRESSRARIGTHMPRALRYDVKTDTLYVAGFGSDEIMALAEASTPSIRLDWRHPIANCAPTGVDVTDSGDVIAFCSHTRTVATISMKDDGGRELASSEELTRSRLSKDALAGRFLFRRGNSTALSTMGAMACANCHPEGRMDGLSWRIQGNTLQTPLLAGRTLGTHPFKWDGGDKDLQTSLRSTVTRLGGTGISNKEAEQIEAFLASMDKPRTPTVKDTKAVARGKKLFASKKVGCARCHAGKLFTNGKSYDYLAEDLEKVDTPSLLGVGLSAPYYHDGSASTLSAVLRENGSVHGMGKVSNLSDQNIDDLVAYLETL